MTKKTGITRVTGMTKMTRVTRVTWMTRVIKISRLTGLTRMNARMIKLTTVNVVTVMMMMTKWLG